MRESSLDCSRATSGKDPGGGKSALAPQPGLTYFLYDGETLLMEMDSLGNATAVNTWGPNGLVSRRTGSGSVWYHFDERGCTVQRTNASGNVIDSYQTDAYGAVSPTPTTTDPYIGLGAQWGYYRDAETGLQLCTYRYYDPLEGRWLTQDPIGMAGGLNLYGYVGGNPAGWVDPLGLDRVLVLYGDRSRVSLFDPLGRAFEECFLRKHSGPKDTVVRLKDPHYSQAIDELLRADKVFFWGHAWEQGAGLCINSEEVLEQEALDLFSLLRDKPLKRLHIHGCYQGRFASDWLRIAESVVAYEGVTTASVPAEYRRGGAANFRSGRPVRRRKT